MTRLAATWWWRGQDEFLSRDKRRHNQATGTSSQASVWVGRPARVASIATLPPPSAGSYLIYS